MGHRVAGVDTAQPQYRRVVWMRGSSRQLHRRTCPGSMNGFSSRRISGTTNFRLGADRGASGLAIRIATGIEPSGADVQRSILTSVSVAFSPLTAPLPVGPGEQGVVGAERWRSGPRVRWEL